MAAELLPTITFFATLLGLGVLVLSITKKAKIPDALFLLVVGLIFGPTILNLVDVSRMGDIPEFLRTLALIVIVFAGSFHLKKETFQRVSRVALKLSFGGFFFVMFFMAIVAHSLFNLTPLSSILLAAIIAGTSSAAVNTFRATLQKEKDVMDILMVESIFSDPLTVLIPILLLGAVAGVATSGTFVLTQFWQSIAAGVGTGVVIGLATAELFNRMQRELSPILSFSVAMIAFAAASNVGGSGILAVAIAAMILGNLNIPYKKIIGEFEDSLSIVLTISVFTLLGAQIALAISIVLLVKILLFVFILIFIARPLFAAFALRSEKLPVFDKLMIALTAPRGAAAAAMAAIPLTYAMRAGSAVFIQEGQLILLTTFLVIVITLIIGTIVGMVFPKLHKHPDTKTTLPKEESKPV